MSEDEIHQPNDKLFSATFRVPANTAALLRAELPPPVAALVDWDRIQLLPGSFVDSQYRRSHTDLLFSAPFSGRSGLIYVLFEHQSSPDRRLPLRLLRYLTRIWEAHAGAHPAPERLPVILPVVLSQNAEAWDIPTRLSGMLDIPDSAAEDLRPFIPDFAFHHLQLAGMAFEAIPGTASGVLVLRAMKAERLGLLLDEAVWDDELIVGVPTEVFYLVLRYILGTDIDKEGFETRLRSIRDPDIRTSAMTLAQRYHQEGRQEGRQEDVLEALAIRFDHVPEGLREAVIAVSDEDRLRDLHRAAIRCETLEEFAKRL